MGNECWGATVNPLLVGFGMIYMTLWATPAIVIAYVAGRSRWRIVWRTPSQAENLEPQMLERINIHDQG